MVVGNHIGKVKIGASTYDIFEQNDLVQKEGYDGKICYNDRKIFLQAGDSKENQKQVLCHEIVHGILKCEMVEKELGNDEKFVELLSKQLYILLNENDIDKLLEKEQEV